MSTADQSKVYFEEHAQEWDELRSGYYTQAVREAAIQKAYLRPEMVVADVGAGTGYMAARLAPLVSQVHLVDNSPAMLEVAKSNLAGLANVQYHVAEGLTLPFADASLDAVFANMYLHHCLDPQAAIAEIVRTLKPGGRLVLTDMDAHPYEWMRQEMADQWLGFERAQVRLWMEVADLVNLVIDSTGESCNARIDAEDTLSDQQEARISIFVATATRRIAARQAVQEGYTLAAERGSCGCSTPAAQSSSSCCTPQPVISAQTLIENVDIVPDYSAAELSAIPADAAQISLGCGNPTALANLRPGEVVVDIGSGGGIDVFLAARQVGPTGHVIGVDMTPAMLERARRNAEKAGLPQVEFRQGQAEALPVGDGMVDVIISNCVINLTEDKGRVFREAYRILKPGGRLEVSDVVASGAMPLPARMDTLGWSECVTGALPEAEYLDLIRQAGFQDVRVQRSPASGDIAGVEVYSALVSARKVHAPSLLGAEM